MEAAAAVARRALVRQAWQTCAAVGMAAVGIVVSVPIALAFSKADQLASWHELLVGEVFVNMYVTGITSFATEECCIAMARGLALPRVPARALAVHAVGSVAWVGAGRLVGATGGGHRLQYSVWLQLVIGLLCYLLSSPIAQVLRPRQGCAARVRRTVRELFGAVVRLSFMTLNISVVAYVYVTVHSELEPASEVLVMGLAVPFMQAVCMLLLARLMSRRTLLMRKTAGHRRHMVTSDALAQEEAHEEAQQAQQLQQEQLKQLQLQLKQRKEAGKSEMRDIVALCAEVFYTAGAFTMLMLVESAHTFFFSLISTLTIQVAQVAVTIKTRRVVARVSPSASVRGTAAEAESWLLDCEASVHQWLMHQELGEKLGMLAALGFIAINKGLGRHEEVLRTVDTARFLRRGLAVLLMKAIGDLCKDATSQVMVSHARESAAGVRLPVPGVALAVVAVVISLNNMQLGLALALRE